MHQYNITQWLIALFICINCTNLHASEYPTNSFAADIEEGIIGTFEDIPMDSPVDNVFKVQLEKLPLANEEVWLSYDLYGLNDHSSVTRSINDQLAIGGHLIRKFDGWQKQEEQINSNWLKEGNNIIRFTIPENASYAYKIKNLNIIFRQKESPAREIVLNPNRESSNYQDWSYVKGFVKGAEQDEKRFDGLII